MENIDKLIRDYLANKSRESILEQGPECPGQDQLMSYVAGRLGKERRKALEVHVAECSYCLDQLASAHEAQQAYKKGQIPEAPSKLAQRAKVIAGEVGAGTSTRARISMPKRGLKRHLWLLIASICFVLSFFFHRYFLQFLVATLIFGGKWIAESNSARALVMVIDSWRRHSKDRDEQVDQLLKRSNQGNRL